MGLVFIAVITVGMIYSTIVSGITKLVTPTKITLQQECVILHDKKLTYYDAENKLKEDTSYSTAEIETTLQTVYFKSSILTTKATE